MKRQISISSDLYRRLHAVATANTMPMAQVVEQALDGEWSAEGCKPRVRHVMPVDLSPELADAIKREVDRKCALGEQVTARGLLEEILVDALDREGAKA